MIVERTSEGYLRIQAPAKLNLFLEVLNKRLDGYHNINSLFQAVSLFDLLEFRAVSSSGVRIDLEQPGGLAQPDGLDQPGDLPLDDRNLIARAYNLIRERYKLDSGLEVRLQKNIPIAAGLAGGSTDGAATIRACNIIFDLGLSNKEMSEIGLEIGSDLPFFFSGGQAIVTGRGEILEPSTMPTDYRLILVTPRLAVSTARAYAELRMGLTNSKDAFRLQACRSVGELVAALRLTANDFEQSQIESHPLLGRIRSELLDCGALLVRMSGSGPTMFGLFDVEPDEKSVLELREEEWLVNEARPISLEE